MKFGVFDHFDDSGAALGELYENRLRLIEVYDRLGFHAYHVAEHHSTPLGMAASPSLLLAAVANRTTSIKFGATVYLLPFYHPLRLIEEVCILDHMSKGRLQLGVGRGASPFEAKLFGVDFTQSQQMYHEAYELLLRGLTHDELTFKGQHYHFENVPMLLKPLQRPHPPLWYGISNPANADWPAANDVNVLIIGTRHLAKAAVDRYLAERNRLGKDPRTLPLIGMNKHVVVAETDAEALRIARRAYLVWRESFRWLFKRFNIAPPPAIDGAFPPSFDELVAMGNGIAGTPKTVRDFVAAEIEATGINYFVCWLAFGDLTVEELTRSAELLAKEVMPGFTGNA